MKQERSDKYSVAWFKLAECISRKEKERALGVYRLLAHSFDNEAVSYQLEGDILLAFNDRAGAVKLYEKAARLYVEQKEFTKATAVYDHLFTVFENQEYVEKIIVLYAQLKQPAQVLVYVQHLCVLMLRQEEFEQVLHMPDRFGMTPLQRIDFIEETACRAIADHPMSAAMKIKILYAALDLIMGDVQMLGRFFSKLKSLNMHYYHEACQYVERASE